LASSGYAEIDGSLGEGGGQILRTAVSLSAITGKAVQVSNIRAKRANPGLRPQHLTGIKILAELFSAETENLQLGADWIRFRPSSGFRGGQKRFDVGTAGSIPMILLTVIPAVALSGKELEVELVGGTDVRASPTLDYIRYVVLEAYRSIGIKFSLDVKKRGYYPKGGGVVSAKIEPCSRPEIMELTESRDFEPRIASVCCQLPRHVAERQTTSAIIALEKKGFRCRNYTASLETAASPGTSVVVYSSTNFGPYVGGDSIGELGKRAESVGLEAAERFLENALSGVPIDPFLSDMLVLPLALAKGKSRYRVARATKHLETNLQVTSQLVGCTHRIIAQQDGTQIVEIEG
jgi:RNA 3'-terminal phosphate cyclase (ATP)